MVGSLVLQTPAAAQQSSATVINPLPPLATSIWTKQGVPVTGIRFEGVTFAPHDAIPESLTQQPGTRLDPEKEAGVGGLADAPDAVIKPAKPVAAPPAGDPLAGAHLFVESPWMYGGEAADAIAREVCLARMATQESGRPTTWPRFKQHVNTMHLSRAKSFRVHELEKIADTLASTSIATNAQPAMLAVYAPARAGGQRISNGSPT